MEKSKKFRMPAGIRNKLMAAVAMLLVSSIMMVSSTYAWFTLSTAPEVTGITTSVGANGNLEIALLTTETYADTDEIKSGVGDSTAATGDVTRSNITWGNLVDLSDASYGLNLIALNPAALNRDADTNLVGATLLKTAEYGADGRVADLKDNTVSGIYDSATAKWVISKVLTEGNDPVQTQGVRAIGVDSSMTTAEIVLNAAKAVVNSGKNGAASPISNAVNAGDNKNTFLTLAMSANDDSKTTYSAKELAALKDVAEGVQTSLNTIVKVYSNAVLATLAANEATTEEVLTGLRGQLSGNTSASALVTLMNTAGVTNATYTARLNDLAAAQTSIETVLGKFTEKDGVVGTVTGTPEASVTVDVKEEIVKPLIGTSVTVNSKDGGTIDSPSMENVTSIASIYVSGGLVAAVAADAGTYLMTTAYEIPVYAGAANTTGNLADIATNVAALNPPTGGDAEKTIADFYGYIIDFAFRTNAATSNLQLQTAPTNRVYSDAEGANLVTQGAGSTATFAFDSALNAEQVQTLLGAVRLVFLNPENGTVYGTAGLADVEVGATAATANVKMEGQTGDNATITPLTQNTATKVSVLVYLDGAEVDNGDVANSASSGMLNLNLQFSSSANLVPMKNTTLQNMILTYTELTDTDYKAGLYTYGGTVYMVKDGYKFYEGSDNMIYFSTDEANYTKLTAVNVTTALEPVMVTFNTTDNVVKAGETLALSVTGTNITGATVKKVGWTSADAAVASVTDADTTDAAVVVNGVTAGSTKIKAAVELEIAYKATENGAEVDKTLAKTMNVDYAVSVTAAAAPEGGEGN